MERDGRPYVAAQPLRSMCGVRRALNEAYVSPTDRRIQSNRPPLNGAAQRRRDNGAGYAALRLRRRNTPSAIKPPPSSESDAGSGTAAGSESTVYWIS
jgi:hypothetical protein